MKKKIMMLLCAAFLCITAYAQKISADKVPSPVMNAFKAKFPNAANPKWEMEDEKDYEVNFKMSNVAHSAVFNAKGVWLQTESELKVVELPASVTQAIAKQFPGFKVEKGEKFEDVAHGSCYEVEIEKGEETFDVLMKANGEVISKKAIEENEGKEEKGDKD